MESKSEYSQGEWDINRYTLIADNGRSIVLEVYCPLDHSTGYEVRRSGESWFMPIKTLEQALRELDAPTFAPLAGR